MFQEFVNNCTKYLTVRYNSTYSNTGFPICEEEESMVYVHVTAAAVDTLSFHSADCATPAEQQINCLYLRNLFPVFKIRDSHGNEDGDR